MVPCRTIYQLKKISEDLAEALASKQYSGRTINLYVVSSLPVKLSESLAESFSCLPFVFLECRVCKYDTYERVTRAKTPGSNLFYSDAPTLFRYALSLPVLHLHAHLHLLKSDSDRIAKELLDKIISERRIAFDQKRSVKGCGGKRNIRLRLIGIRMSNLRDDKALSGGKSGMGDLSSVSPPFDSCIERGH